MTSSRRIALLSVSVFLASPLMAAASDSLDCLVGWSESFDRADKIFYKVSATTFDLTSSGHPQITVAKMRHKDVVNDVEVETKTVDATWTLSGDSFKVVFDGGELTGSKGYPANESHNSFFSHGGLKDGSLKLTSGETFEASCSFKKRDARISRFVSTLLASPEYAQTYQTALAGLTSNEYAIAFSGYTAAPTDSSDREELVTVRLGKEDLKFWPPAFHEYATITGMVRLGSTADDRWTVQDVKLNVTEAPLPNSRGY